MIAKALGADAWLSTNPDFELLYAHMIPDMITNIVTFVGVLVILLTINGKLALITCAPIPLILLSSRCYRTKWSLPPQI